MSEDLWRDRCGNGVKTETHKEDEYIGRSYALVDIRQIERNLCAYMSALPDGFSVTAVVKADAYGHGDLNVVKRLCALGVETFAVATAREGARLREGGVSGEILILGYTPPEEMEAVVKLGLTQTLVDEVYADELSKLPYHSGIKAQYAIDTGMNRIGLDAEKPALCRPAIMRAAEQFDLKGIYTHLCAADGDGERERRFTQEQIGKFAAIAGSVSSLNLKAHCLNSAGGLYYSRELPAEISKNVRLGIALYGLKPSEKNTLPLGIQPALSWRARVSMVKAVKRGESIGYGLAYTADRNRLIATVTVGYADGYSRRASGRAYVLINGMRAPVVGRVCMDQMTVDVSDQECVCAGDEVVLIGRSGNEILTAEMLAEMTDTIGYEVVCGISDRVKRKYID